MPDSLRKAYIITNPMIAANRSAEVTLSKFLRVIRPCYDELIVIGGNLNIESDLDDVQLVTFPIVRAESKVKRTLDIFRIQLLMSNAIRSMIRRDDPVYFWIGDKMIIPFRLLQSIGAEINYFIMGNVSKEGSMNQVKVISNKMARYMAEHADYICMESKSVVDEWPQLKEKQTRIIHLYTERIEMAPYDKRKKTLGMICRLAEGKHVVECIKAMAEVHKNHPDWTLEIVGSGKQQEQCESLICSLGAKDYISLLGWIDHEKIAEATAGWKYLLFPTDTEGMPNGLIEMMGRGVPAIATRVGGIKDIIFEGTNGFLLADNSVEAIIEGIQHILAIDESSYLRISENAYQTIAKEFSFESAVKTARSSLGAIQ